jgi:hypothetical protein
MYKNRKLPLEERMAMEDALVKNLVDSGMTGTDLKTEIANIAKWVKGDADSPSNPVVKGDLDTKALQVINGSMTMEAYKKEVKAARRDPEGINDKDYVELIKTAGREMDITWGQALSDADDSARRQIVDKEKSEFEIWMARAMDTGTADATIEDEKEKQKLQYQAVDYLNQELLEWVDKYGTTKSLAEFNDFKQERIEHYDALKVDQIRQIKVKRATERIERVLTPVDQRVTQEVEPVEYDIEANIISALSARQSFEQGSGIEIFETGVDNWRRSLAYFNESMDDNERLALVKITADGSSDQINMALLMLAAKYETAQAFDPEGSGYDYETARKLGLKPDKTGHWPSRDAKSGLLLKGRAHETWHKTVAGEASAGYEIYKGLTGRYYSRKKK